MRATAAAAGLQFDHVAPTEGAGSTVTCALCKGSVRNEYYDVQGAPTCVLCTHKVQRGLAGGPGPFAFGRALLMGSGAAVLGAIIYYAVIAITNFEIGLVAILIGWLVGRAVRRASRNYGGRRFQLLAVALTYLAVGLAYTPFIAKSEIAKRQGATTGAPSAPTANASGPEADAAPNPVAPAPVARDAGPASLGTLVVALGAAALFVVILPVVVVLGSLPSGLISALIIGIGMQQAWKMTAEEEVNISGPYRIAGAETARAS